GRGAETWPAVIEGRAPQGPDEIVLGAKTLAASHRHIGQTVVVTPQGATAGHPMRIVGRAVFPFFGRGAFNPTGLGEGAAVQVPPREATPDDPAGFNFVLVRLAPNAGAAADIASFRRLLPGASICPQDQVCDVETDKRPVDILNYSRIQGTPLAPGRPLPGGSRPCPGCSPSRWRWRSPTPSPPGPGWLRAGSSRRRCCAPSRATRATAPSAGQPTRRRRPRQRVRAPTGPVLRLWPAVARPRPRPAAPSAA